MSLRPGALLLDMDGLLVDSEPVWFEVEREFARARGGDWTEALAHACVGRGLANALRTMHQVLGLEVDVERDVQALVDGFLARIDTLSLKPGCAELLADAVGRVPLALASSSTRPLVEAIVRRFEWSDALGAIVTGDDVASPKPAPDIFLEAARRLGVEPATCVVLEDSLAGARAGRAGGMSVIAVPEREPDAFVDVTPYVVRDLFEARAHLVW